MAKVIKNKYYIGERVGGGTIFGLVSATYAIAEWIRYGLYTAETYEAHPWFEKYPNWMNEPVYYVLYDSPRHTLTFEEFAKESPQIKKECLYEEYEKSFKVSKQSLPEGSITAELCNELFQEKEEGEEDGE